MALPEQGKLSDKPLAELIREFGEASAAGALRLSRDRAKTVVYFENGSIIFAASNIRSYRLSEFLKRRGIVNDEALANTSAAASDEELLAALVKQNKIKKEQVANIRATHVTDILRATLLWTEGDWQFDTRVRLAGDTRVTIDALRLLLEATRHLPADYLAARFPDPNEQIAAPRDNGNSAKLLPQEAFVASRLQGPMTITELEAVSGLGQEETLRAVYALAISGVVQRGAWAPTNGVANAEIPSETRVETVEEFVARIDKASDHYSVLGVSRRAEGSEIKSAYHAMARHYHPDRFHQADAALRTRIESAFARVARAYETLGDTAAREAYDAQFSGTDADAARSGTDSPEGRAAESFRKGVALMKQNQPQQALRFFAEAATIQPRCARYRAEYGRALINDPQTRRSAEIELKAAVALEPTNAGYRIVLAELYKTLGLRRRAEGELQRALMADPKSETARAMLAGLKN
jgi:curved DNA-binding protein CbpA